MTISSRGVRPSKSGCARVIQRERLIGPPGNTACSSCRSGNTPVGLSASNCQRGKRHSRPTLMPISFPDVSFDVTLCGVIPSNSAAASLLMPSSASWRRCENCSLRSATTALTADPESGAGPQNRSSRSSPGAAVAAASSRASSDSSAWFTSASTFARNLALSLLAGLADSGTSGSMTVVDNP